MTREEKIKQNARKYAEPLADSLHFGDSPMTRARIHAFIKGAEWADEHPREGLWDSEKVIKWILENADKHTWYDETENECGITNDFIKDLQKAMEE